MLTILLDWWHERFGRIWPIPATRSAFVDDLVHAEGDFVFHCRFIFLSLLALDN